MQLQAERPWNFCFAAVVVATGMRMSSGAANLERGTMSNILGTCLLCIEPLSQHQQQGEVKGQQPHEPAVASGGGAEQGTV